MTDLPQFARDPPYYRIAGPAPQPPQQLGAAGPPAGPVKGIKQPCVPTGSAELMTQVGPSLGTCEISILRLLLEEKRRVPLSL